MFWPGRCRVWAPPSVTLRESCSVLCLNTVVSFCFPSEICNPIDPPLSGLGAEEWVLTSEPLGAQWESEKCRHFPTWQRAFSSFSPAASAISCWDLVCNFCREINPQGEILHISSGATQQQGLHGCSESLLFPAILAIVHLGKTFPFLFLS